MKKSNYQIIKKIILKTKMIMGMFILISFGLLLSCENDNLIDINTEQGIDNESIKGNSKIDVCHNAGPSKWVLINVNENSWKAHQAHGDVRLDDQDNDGFVPDNACDYGNMGDCDDTNATINPGAMEIEANGIDDDCDGEIDECFCLDGEILEQFNFNLFRDYTGNYSGGTGIVRVTFLRENSTSSVQILEFITGSLAGVTSCEVLQNGVRTQTSLLSPEPCRSLLIAKASELGLACTGCNIPE